MGQSTYLSLSKASAVSRAQLIAEPKFRCGVVEALRRRIELEAGRAGCRDWKTYLASAPVASATFLAYVEDLPVQEREL